MYENRFRCVQPKSPPPGSAQDGGVALRVCTLRQTLHIAVDVGHAHYRTHQGPASRLRSVREKVPKQDHHDPA